jgi:hypothetical protein
MLYDISLTVVAADQPVAVHGNMESVELPIVELVVPLQPATTVPYSMGIGRQGGAALPFYHGFHHFAWQGMAEGRIIDSC